MEIFGFEIKRANDSSDSLQAIVPQTHEDGATEVVAGAPTGMYGGTYIDIEGSAKNEAALVTKYREIAMHPECDFAIEDIINDAIIMDDNTYPAEIVLDDTVLSARVKKLVRAEFESLQKILDFGNKGYEIFRRWYVDGRLYYQLVINENDIKEGIKELRYIDPRKIRKVRQNLTQKDKKTGAVLYKGVKEFYFYNPKGLGKDGSNQGVKIAADSICYVTSGLVDPMNKFNLGHLHKAIKPLNQLRMLEDATVIYRLSRAPERRIFYIDVGNLPKAKAEQYLRDMMVKHKNKLVYDAQTGEIKDDRKHMTMLEDFWLPRREGGRGTEITTLPGGQNLGELDDVLYFQKKLYKALNVPVSRLEAEVNFNIGRSTEISRDEIKFQKFINRLRNKFAVLFDNLLEIQVVLRGIMTRAEWQEAKNNITYNFVNDNHFEELKEAEIMEGRLRLLSEIDPLVGKYFSTTWVRKNVLKMTEEEIELMSREIEIEGGDGEDDDSPFTGLPGANEPEDESEDEVEENYTSNTAITEETDILVQKITSVIESSTDNE